MTTRQIAYRLKSEGKAELLRDQREVGQGFRDSFSAAEQGAVKAGAAADQLERKYQRMAQAALSSAEAQRSQARYDALLGVTGSSAGSARDSAEVFRQMAEAEESAALRAQQLRAVIDPLGAATDRLNAELADMDALHRRGAISSAELARAQALARTRFDETAAAIGRNERGLTRLAVASRLNLARQGADVFVTAAMGMNPAMIAIQQGPQILDAAALSGIKLNASLIALASGFALVGGAAVAATAAWSSGEAAAGRLESATTGLGRASGITAAELARVADENNEAGRVTIGTAEKMAAAYVQLAGTSEAEIGRLISMTRGFAELTGVDAKNAVEEFTKAVGDPLKTATDLTRSSLGLFTQAEIENIAALQESGDLLAARAALLDGLKGAIDNHVKDAAAIESAWDAVGLSIKGAWEWLGRYLYRDESERLQSVIDRRSSIERGQRENGRPLDARTQGVYDMLGREGQAILDARAARDRQQAQASANQRAQLDADRRRAAPGGGGRAVSSSRGVSSSTADRDQAEADRIIVDLTRQEEAARRERLERWLKGGPSPETRATLERELYRLDIESRDAGLKAQEETLLKAGRLDEEARLALQRLRAANEETDAARDAEVAVRERSEIESARREAARRALDREVEALSRAAELARMRGDDSEYARLDRRSRVATEARRLQSDPEFKAGNFAAWAVAEARVSEEIYAETIGGFRRGLGGFVQEIESSGIGNAFARQLMDAGDRWLDRFLNSIANVDFSGGSDSGIGSWVNKGLNFLFPKNAEGTDYWTGGPTWVGERGPELLDLPRGSRVVEHARSLQMMRDAAQPSRAASAAPMTYAPTYHINGVDTARIEAILAKDRREFSAKAVAANRDADSRRLGLG